MANLKSSKKQARKNIKQRAVNLRRQTAIKTAVKKVLTALEQSEITEKMNELLRAAEVELARAKNKGALHARTAARKMSRLAKRVSKAIKKS